MQLFGLTVGWVRNCGAPGTRLEVVVWSCSIRPRVRDTRMTAWRLQFGTRVIVGAMVCLSLVACAGSGSVEPMTGAPVGTLFTMSGSVADGPVVGAEITAIDALDRVVQTATSDDLANYTIDIPAGTALPVRLIATGGIDLVTQRAPDFSTRYISRA